MGSHYNGATSREAKAVGQVAGGMGMRGGAVCHVTPVSAVVSLRIPHSALGKFVAQGVRGWRRIEGAWAGQNKPFVLLSLLPLPPALQVLHGHT